MHRDHRRSRTSRELAGRTGVLLVPVLALVASCSSASGDAAGVRAPESASASAEGFTWPPTEGTDGSWTAVPEQLVAPTGAFPACGSTITADYAPGVALEYQAEVSPTTTTVRYRAAVADVDVVGADGTSVLLDITGPATEVYTYRDGDLLSERIELAGAAFFSALTPEEQAAVAAAGLPATSYWTDGTLTLDYAFTGAGSAGDSPSVVVTSTASAVQDVCQVLAQSAAAAPTAPAPTAPAPTAGAAGASRSRVTPV